MMAGEAVMGENSSERYLSPGAYMEEVSSGSRPIEGVGTAVAAFVGLAPGGPVDFPRLARAVLAGLALVVAIRLVRNRE